MSKIKPSAVLKLEKGKLYDLQRDRTALEPQPITEVKPRCPQGLTPAERKHWRAYATALDTYGLLQAGNAGILKRLATAALLYEQLRSDYLETKIAEVGAAMLRVGRDMDAMEDKLGLPAIARAKIGSLALRALKKRDEIFDD